MNKVVMAKILICSIFIIILLINSSYAFGNIFSIGKSSLEKGNGIYEKVSRTKLVETSDDVYNFLLGFATMIAVIIAMVIGIKLMWSTAEEKAKVKEMLMPFVIGCIVVFGAFTIWKIVVKIGNEVEDSIEVKEGLDFEEDTEKIEQILFYCADCGKDLNSADTVKFKRFGAYVCRECSGNYGGRAGGKF